MGRRVLVTGLGTFWGGRLAQAIEKDPDIDVIVGLDRFEPTIELERTEFVRVDQSYSILSRIVKAAQIDTILHTFLIADSTQVSDRTLHEINVIGTMNLLAAASATDSSVRTVVVKGSSLVYGSAVEDPVWFKEESRRSHAPKTNIERSLVEVESYLRDFAEDNPHVAVSLLRFSNVLGPDITTPLSSALELPIVPSVFGFDPRIQFIHEDDVLRALLFVLRHDESGIFNVAGDGVLPWSEVAAICGKRVAPVISPYLSELSALPLRRLGICDLPPEAIDLLKFGRGLDTRRIKRAGFELEYTSAGAVESFWQAVRLRRTVGGGADDPGYVYERDVESFFRHSPAVVRDVDA
jgi:UDP-glucose 4-epimerase